MGITAAANKRGFRLILGWSLVLAGMGAPVRGLVPSTFGLRLPTILPVAPSY